jgi:hypothetical protein
MDIKLSDIVDVNSIDAVFAETAAIAAMVSTDFDADRFRSVYDDIVSIYQGRYPGYKACNTEYHDLSHVLQVTMATARLAHAVHEAGSRIDHFDLLMLLVSAMLHDTGYIQPSSDEQGTGAKHTLVHVDKSIHFAKNYLESVGFGNEALEACPLIIKATDIAVRIDEIPFLHENWERLAKIMATGDIIAQIADRIYLEKLLLLYREFKEGRVPGFDSELDLLKKTLGFYKFALKRMDHDLGGFRRHLKLHFEKRLGISEDLYQKAFDHNLQYLTFLLDNHTNDYRDMLQRGSVVKKMMSHE